MTSTSEQAVEVYRLWPDATWDTAPVLIDTREPLTIETVEVRACEVAWLEIDRQGGPKPVQIGLYMPSYYSAGLPM